MSAIARRPRARRRSSRSQRLVWDSALEAQAQAYAERCRFVHSSPGNGVYGENLAVGTWTPSNPNYMGAAPATTLWADEQEDWTYSSSGSGTCAPSAVCGHWTQMIWASSSRLGCGAAVCSSVESAGGLTPPLKIVVCQYTGPGNYVGQPPYASGTPCSACPSAFPTCTCRLCTNATLGTGVASDSDLTDGCGVTEDGGASGAAATGASLGVAAAAALAAVASSLWRRHV
jgi:hypothetical protein